MPLLRSGALKDFARQSENERKQLVLSLKTLVTVIGAPGLTGTHVLEHAALEFVSAHENATIPRKRDNKINSIPIKFSFIIFG